MSIQAREPIKDTEKICTVQGKVAASYSGWGRTAAALPQAMDGVQKTKTNNRIGILVERYGMDSWLADIKKARLFAVREEPFRYQGKDEIIYYSFQNLLEVLFGIKAQPKCGWNFNGDIPAGAGGGCRETAGRRRWGKQSGDTIFSSCAAAVNRQGETFDYDIRAYFTRRLLDSTGFQIDYKAAYYVPPLVVYTDTDEKYFKRQRFLFDIASEDEDIADNFEDETPGGYVIFYISGIGWISVTDIEFGRIRIWTKDACGNDKLIAFGVSGAGVVYIIWEMCTPRKHSCPDTAVMAKNRDC